MRMLTISSNSATSNMFLTLKVAFVKKVGFSFAYVYSNLEI